MITVMYDSSPYKYVGRFTRSSEETAVNCSYVTELFDDVSKVNHPVKVN